MCWKMNPDIQIFFDLYRSGLTGMLQISGVKSKWVNYLCLITSVCFLCLCLCEQGDRNGKYPQDELSMGFTVLHVFMLL